MEHQAKNPNFQTTRTSSQLHATIITWDDDSGSYKSTFDEPTEEESHTYRNYLSTSMSQQIFTSIAESLRHNRDKIASLARLVVAFSPPDRAVKLENINHIHVIKVTNSYIEISAVVCDETECV